MVVSLFSVCGLLLVLHLHVCCSLPIMSDSDVDLLKVILQKLEESSPKQADRDLDLLEVEQTANRNRVRPEEVEAIRQFLSTKNLKSVRDDSSWRSSSCFGRRMDRIGSMSSLGCNTVKHNPK